MGIAQHYCEVQTANEFTFEFRKFLEKVLVIIRKNSRQNFVARSVLKTLNVTVDHSVF